VRARPLGLLSAAAALQYLRSVFFFSGLRSDEVLYASFNIGYSRFAVLKTALFCKVLYSVFKRFCVAEKVTFYSEV
jgi:hypothetical protein